MVDIFLSLEYFQATACIRHQKNLFFLHVSIAINIWGPFTEKYTLRSRWLHQMKKKYNIFYPSTTISMRAVEKKTHKNRKLISNSLLDNFWIYFHLFSLTKKNIKFIFKNVCVEFFSHSFAAWCLFVRSCMQNIFKKRIVRARVELRKEAVTH